MVLAGFSSASQPQWETYGSDDDWTFIYRCTLTSTATTPDACFAYLSLGSTPIASRGLGKIAIEAQYITPDIIPEIIAEGGPLCRLIAGPGTSSYMRARRYTKDVGYTNPFAQMNDYLEKQEGIWQITFAEPGSTPANFRLGSAEHSLAGIDTGYFCISGTVYTDCDSTGPLIYTGNSALELVSETSIKSPNTQFVSIFKIVGDPGVQVDFAFACPQSWADTGVECDGMTIAYCVDDTEAAYKAAATLKKSLDKEVDALAASFTNLRVCRK